MKRETGALVICLSLFFGSIVRCWADPQDGFSKKDLKKTKDLKTKPPKDEKKEPTIPPFAETPVIMDGMETLAFSKPFMVALAQYYSGQEVGVLCGGFLISPDVVMTAAHCLKLSGVSAIAVGRHNLTAEGEERSQIIPSGMFRTYWSSHFDNVDDGYDFGFIFLDEPLDMEGLDVISLSRDPAVPVDDGQSIQALGWGQTHDEDSSAVLKEADMTYHTDLVCSRLWSTWPLHDTSFCAIFSTGSVCFGDSGGPIMLNGPDPDDYSDDIVVGVASFVYGNECSQRHYNGFAKVASQIDWINSNVCYHSVVPPDDFDCDSLPYLTLVAKGTTETGRQSLDLILDINEPNRGEEWLTVIQDYETSIWNAQIKRLKIPLYPVDETSHEYRLELSPFPIIDTNVFELWEGEPGEGTLLTELNYEGETFHFEFNANGAQTPSPSQAPSMVPTESLMPSGEDEAVPADGPYLEIKLTFDEWAAETSWEVSREFDDGSSELVFGVELGAYTEANNGKTIFRYVPLEVGPDGATFNFTIYDSYGDGMCCDGGYELTYYDEVFDATAVGSFGDNYIFSDSVVFTVDGSVSDLPELFDARFTIEAMAAYNLCADVFMASPANGAQFKTWGCHRSPNQQFQLIQLDDGYYWIQAVHSSKCLSVAGPSRGDAGFIIQFDCQERDLMKWIVEERGDGIQFLNRYSQGCLSTNGEAKAGASLWTVPCEVDEPSQLWKYGLTM